MAWTHALATAAPLPPVIRVEGGAAGAAWLLVALPALGALVLFVGGRRTDRWGHLLGVGTVVAAFVYGVVLFLGTVALPAEEQVRDLPLYDWIAVASLNVEFGLRLDPLSLSFVLLITGVGSLIHIYSVGYMSHDPNRRKFFAQLNLFVAAMLVLVLGNGFVTLYLGWEGVGLASYLLIGFYTQRRSAGSAAKKAFLMNRVGDVGLAIAIFILFLELGTTQYAEVFARAGEISPGALTAITLLLLLGACGKSGQFPLQAWLPDAMEGPTPVSALIHAATMVTAGVYLIARSNPLYDLAPIGQLVVTIVGAITLLIGAIIGCAYDDIKKVLAYSTVSQIGYMMLAVGLGPVGYAAALAHLFAHGFFKAGLFLGAGSVMHGMADETDMRRYGGLRRHMPVTFWTFTLGYLALIGFPFLSGYFTKDLIIEAALTAGPVAGWLLGGVALLAAGLTAFYMTRLMLMTFFGEERWRDLRPRRVDPADLEDPPEHYHPHESAASMTVPMILLAIGSVGAGAYLVLGERLAHFLEPSIGATVEPTRGARGDPGRAGPDPHRGAHARGGRPRLRPRRTSRRAGRAPAAGEPARARRPGRPLRQHDQRERHRPAGHLALPRAGLRRQPRRRRRRQRHRRPAGRHVRPAAAQSDRLRPHLRPDHPGRLRRARRGPAHRRRVPRMSAVLLVLLLLPLVGAAVVGAMARREDLDRAAKILGLALSVVSLVLVIVLWAGFRTGPGTPRFQAELSAEWIPAFGTRFALGLDGIALTMIALLAVLVPIVLWFAWSEKLPAGRTGAGFTALMLSTQGVLVGVFAATDVFLFYVLFEAMLIPMYFLIGRFGGPRRQYAAVKFFLYSFLGGLIMLASVIGLFVASDTRLGQGTFDWAALQGMAAQLPLSTQIPLFLGFFAAFAIKAPLVPFHTWLPDAGAEAPIAGGVILLGLLDKVGTFGFLRYNLPLFPAASRELAPLLLTLAVIGVVYGSLLAAVQTDMKRFVAYTSIAHFGFIALGIFAFSSQSIAGSALYMVNHGISTAMLFLVVGLLIRRGGTASMTEYGGVGRIAPLLAGMFLIAGLSTHRPAGDQLVHQRVPGAAGGVPARARVQRDRDRRHRLRRALHALGLPARDDRAAARLGGGR